MSNSTPGHALPIASGALSSNSFRRVEDNLMNASESFRQAMQESLTLDEDFHHTIAQFLFSTNCMVQVWQKKHPKELGI